MVAPSGRKPLRQIDVETTEFGGTVQFTGGQTFERRFENEYGKMRHRESDEAAEDEMARFGPNISLPRILGGIRES